MCEAVLTQTNPGPPPGAGVAALVTPVAGAAAGGAAGDALTELLGLNKSLSEEFFGILTRWDLQPQLVLPQSLACFASAF